MRVVLFGRGPGEALRERGQPRTIGGESEVTDAEASEDSTPSSARSAAAAVVERGRGASGRRCRPGAIGPVSGSIRVSSPTSTRRVLARVGDLEGDDRVTAGDLGQGRDPVARTAEVRDDHDHAGGRPDRADQGQGAGRRGLAAALLGRLGGDGAEEAEHPAAAAGRRR